MRMSKLWIILTDAFLRLTPKKASSAASIHAHDVLPARFCPRIDQAADYGSRSAAVNRTGQILFELSTKVVSLSFSI